MLLFVFVFSHPNGWEVVSHGCGLHLPNDVDLPNIFSCAYFFHLYVFFGQVFV